MDCNILIDELPKTVEVRGKTYKINYGYRACMLIEIDMFSDREDEQKILDALNIFYFNNIPSDKDEAMKQLLRFYQCGATDDKKKSTGSKLHPKNKRAYCFETDAGRIYAAFRTQYGINLNQTKSNDLHWWEFTAMFESLSEDLFISRLMFYRTADLKNMGKNQKAFIKKMRELYPIKHASSSMPDRAKLAKRNQDMKEYVRKRMEECRKQSQELSANTVDT